MRDSEFSPTILSVIAPTLLTSQSHKLCKLLSRGGCWPRWPGLRWRIGLPRTRRIALLIEWAWIALLRITARLRIMLGRRISRWLIWHGIMLLDARIEMVGHSIQRLHFGFRWRCRWARYRWPRRSRSNDRYRLLCGGITVRMQCASVIGPFALFNVAWGSPSRFRNIIRRGFAPGL